MRKYFDFEKKGSKFRSNEQVFIPLKISVSTFNTMTVNKLWKKITKNCIYKIILNLPSMHDDWINWLLSNAMEKLHKNEVKVKTSVHLWKWKLYRFFFVFSFLLFLSHLTARKTGMMVMYVHIVEIKVNQFY